MNSPGSSQMASHHKPTQKVIPPPPPPQHGHGGSYHASSWGSHHDPREMHNAWNQHNAWAAHQYHQDQQWALAHHGYPPSYPPWPPGPWHEGYQHPPPQHHGYQHPYHGGFPPGRHFEKKISREDEHPEHSEEASAGSEEPAIEPTAEDLEQIAAIQNSVKAFLEGGDLDEESDDQPVADDVNDQDNGGGEESATDRGDGANYCDFFEIWLNGPTQWKDHIIGKKHKKKSKKDNAACKTHTFSNFVPPPPLPWSLKTTRTPSRYEALQRAMAVAAAFKSRTGVEKNSTQDTEKSEPQSKIKEEAAPKAEDGPETHGLKKKLDDLSVVAFSKKSQSKRKCPNQHAHQGENDGRDSRACSIGFPINAAPIEKREIIVSNLSGEKEYKARLPCTGSQLKYCLQIAWGAPRSMQQLVAGSDVVNDADALHSEMTPLIMVLSTVGAIAQLQHRDTNPRVRALKDLARCSLKMDERAFNAIRKCLTDPKKCVQRAAEVCFRELSQRC